MSDRSGLDLDVHVRTQHIERFDDDELMTNVELNMYLCLTLNADRES